MSETLHIEIPEEIQSQHAQELLWSEQADEADLVTLLTRIFKEISESGSRTSGQPGGEERVGFKPVKSIKSVILGYVVDEGRITEIVLDRSL